MISDLAVVLPFVILCELFLTPVSFSVPVGICPGMLVVAAVTPMRSCCLLCYLLSLALLGTWKKEKSLPPPKSALKQSKVLLQSIAAVSLGGSLWEKKKSKNSCMKCNSRPITCFQMNTCPLVTRKWHNSVSSTMNEWTCSSLDYLFYCRSR